MQLDSETKLEGLEKVMQIIYLRYRLQEVKDKSSFHPEEDRTKIIEALEWIRS